MFSPMSKKSWQKVCRQSLALDPRSRKNLYASSSDVQALFSPAVSTLQIWLKGNQPDHQILAGLHPRVQPKRLTILAAYLDFWEGYPVEEYGAYHNLNVCVALASCITTFASSPHSNRFNELRLKVTSCCNIYSAGGSAGLWHYADFNPSAYRVSTSLPSQSLLPSYTASGCWCLSG
jgi:hypothetical protein